MVELLKASRYYGPHATGWVVLVNGHPELHSDKRDCDWFVENIRRRREGKPSLPYPD